MTDEFSSIPPLSSTKAARPLDKRITVCATCYKAVSAEPDPPEDECSDPQMCRMLKNYYLQERGLAQLDGPMVWFYSPHRIGVLGEGSEEQQAYYRGLATDRKIKTYEFENEKLKAELWFWRWIGLAAIGIVLVLSLMKASRP